MLAFNDHVYAVGCLYNQDTVDETYLKESQHYNENIQKVVSLEAITDDIFKFTTNFTEETLEAGEAWVNENVTGVKAMTTGFESIDIVLDYVDKGVAIVELAKKLGITMDQVMAFGDNLNDLHMMQVVGHPVAPFYIFLCLHHCRRCLIITIYLVRKLFGFC